MDLKIFIYRKRTIDRAVNALQSKWIWQAYAQGKADGERETRSELAMASHPTDDPATTEPCPDCGVPMVVESGLWYCAECDGYHGEHACGHIRCEPYGECVLGGDGHD